MEIGSEFWLEDNLIKNSSKDFWKFGEDMEFLMSGRTAIDYILQDIENTRTIKNVYFPSYCCESMLIPFRKRNLNIKFYEVDFDGNLKYNIDTNYKCDIFFAMNYFGYTSTNMEEYVQAFKEKGSLVIEDVTHSLLSKKIFSEGTDYIFASLRKWFPILTGAFAAKLHGKFELDKELSENSELLNQRILAMENKKKYIENNCKDNSLKEEYLNEYKMAKRLLEEKYENYAMDSKSKEILFNLDIEKIKKSRKANSEIIYSKLKNTKKLSFLVNEQKEEDCLIFVPIILKQELRDELRQELIKKQIYCPIHWPIDNNLNNIYTRELSLVCDQRYSKEQIEEYIKIILKYLKED